jgi:hypothetical protein
MQDKTSNRNCLNLFILIFVFLLYQSFIQELIHKKLTEIHSHHDPDEILLDFLALGVPHRDERDVPPEMVEAEDRGEQFPLQIPLIRMQSGPESLFEDEGHHMQVWELL